MRIKSLISLTAIFLIQFIMSCDTYDCGCPDPENYEVTFTDFQLDAVNTAGFETELVTDTIHRNAFGMIITVDYTASEVAALEGGASGFSSAMACSCLGEEYSLADSLDYLEVFAESMDGMTIENVTQHFKLIDSDESITATISIPELPEYFFWDQSAAEYQLELIDHDSIPSTATFMVNLYLKSGKKFTAETQLIHFFD